MSYQHTTIVGHIGQDCQIRTLQQGRVVTNFSVAYSETWKDQNGERQERTTWFNCSYFTQSQPGVAEYLRRGALVAVDGRVGVRAYLNGANQPAASLELTVENIRLLSTPKRDEHTHPAEPPATTTTTTTTTPADGDDLPF